MSAIGASGFAELPVRARHAAGVAYLPALHTDPFDRLLVAQAVAEPLQFLTADAPLAQYSELVLLAYAVAQQALPRGMKAAALPRSRRHLR